MFDWDGCVTDCVTDVTDVKDCVSDYVMDYVTDCVSVCVTNFVIFDLKIRFFRSLTFQCTILKGFFEFRLSSFGFRSDLLKQGTKGRVV